jgi:hypothetical protein
VRVMARRATALALTPTLSNQLGLSCAPGFRGLWSSGGRVTEKEREHPHAFGYAPGAAMPPQIEAERAAVPCTSVADSDPRQLQNGAGWGGS